MRFNGLRQTKNILEDKIIKYLIMNHFYLKELDVPLYRGKLVIVLTDDTEKLKSIIPDFTSSHVYAHTFFANYKGIQGFIIVLNFNNKFRKITNGAITHEAVHAANFIAMERGFVAGFENDEPIAYLTEFIADEVYMLMEENDFRAVLEH